MPYLTPPSLPSGVQCRPLRIPAGSEWLAIVTGALLDLLYARNFEQSPGGLTPEQTADAFSTMFDEYLSGQCNMPIVGEVRMVAYNFTDADGWLVCDGRAVSRTTYAQLFAVLGTTWGAGDGSTTFNLPATNYRSPRGGAGFEPVGTLQGSDTATLGQSNLPVDTFVSAGTSRVVVTTSGTTAFIQRKSSAAIPINITPQTFGVCFIIFAGE